MYVANMVFQNVWTLSYCFLYIIRLGIFSHSLETVPILFYFHSVLPSIIFKLNET